MTFSKISVLVPTRGRVDRLRTMIESFELTTVAGGAELLFRIDEDDTATWQVLRCTPYKVFIGPRLDGYRSLLTFFNQLADIATGDVLMCGNDDMVFRTEGWPALVLAAANRYPDGVFNLGYQTFNPGVFPWSTISKVAAERMGGIHDARLFWGDVYLRDVMAAFDRTIMVPEVVIEHQWMGHTPDQTFIEAHQEASVNWDAAYWSLHKQRVDAAVEKLRATC